MDKSSLGGMRPGLKTGTAAHQEHKVALGVMAAMASTLAVLAVVEAAGSRMAFARLTRTSAVRVGQAASWVASHRAMATRSAMCLTDVVVLPYSSRHHIQEGGFGGGAGSQHRMLSVGRMRFSVAR